MKYKNSFFRVRIKTDGTYLDVFPPQNGGKELDVQEVINFLEKKGFTDLSADVFKKSLALMKEKPLQIKIRDIPVEPFAESAVILSSVDRWKTDDRTGDKSGAGTTENHIWNIGFRD